MNKIILLLCFTIGMATSFDLSDMGAMDNVVNMLCSTIASKPESAAMFIDRLEKFMNEHQKQVQQRFVNTYTYVMKEDNKNKLKAGGEGCKRFFNDLNDPLSIDLKNNKELIGFIQQMLEHHLKDLINMIQSLN